MAHEPVELRRTENNRDKVVSKSLYVRARDLEIGLAEEEYALQPLHLGANLFHDVNTQLPRPKSLDPTVYTKKKMDRSSYFEKEAESDIPINNSCLFGTSELSVFERGDRHLAKLNTQLLEAIENQDNDKIKRILKEGANPNATCRLSHESACHLAALRGGDSLSVLIKYGADKFRTDKLGRTPLHLASWAGNAKQIAILLDLPEDVPQNDSAFMKTKTRTRTTQMVNVKCNIEGLAAVIPKTWKDCVEHKCKELKESLPLIEPGWTPLHVASSCGRYHCVRLLLSAGANPNSLDIIGYTPLDVAGSSYYQNCEMDIDNFREVIQILLNAGGKFHQTQIQGLIHRNTPLHTAVELESEALIKELLAADASVNSYNCAGETPLHVCVRKKLDHLQILANAKYDDIYKSKSSVDVQDKNGYTALHAAIEAEWIPGVCIALEAGADITIYANDGETPFHKAATLGNLIALNEILSVAKRNGNVDFLNRKGETALFKAIIHGHLDCVKQLLKERASIKIKIPGNFNVLHIAAKHGRADILKLLLDFIENNSEKRNMINALTTVEHEGLGPIHLAVMHNQVDCIKILLANYADVHLKVLKTYKPYNASTPLHIAAVKNHFEIAKIILDFDKTTLHKVDILGWSPLHAASYYGSREVIVLLLNEGADLSRSTKGAKAFKATAIDMIMHNLSKPTQFMEEVFDSYIHTNDLHIHVPNSQVTVDYRILKSNFNRVEQMKVVEAILETGNRFGQTRLLVHPLIESFLHLNWIALLPFFYMMVGLYALYVTSLNIYIVSLFFYKDTKEVIPIWFDTVVWRCIVNLIALILLLQEILNIRIKSRKYFYQVETWIKFGSIFFAVVVQISMIYCADASWPRHVATAALLLSWSEMMFLLSRFPNWGYYVLMFGKVLSKVIKILLTFIFLIIGFSLSFMVQFRSQVPFDGPWAAFVKTMVMMASEFDYLDLFDKEHVTKLAGSLIIVRLIFLIFLMLAAIVLMNLMVGVAVNDLHNLEIHGNIQRLGKQVEFLASLEALVNTQSIKKNLPNCLKKRKKNIGKITLSRVDFKSIPLHIRDAIFNKAQARLNLRDSEVDAMIVKTKLDAILQACLDGRKKRDEDNFEKTYLLKNRISDRQYKVKSNDRDANHDLANATVAELKLRIDIISTEMAVISNIIRNLPS